MSNLPKILPSVAIPPSELPAADLPDYEPTAADLLAIDELTDDEINERLEETTTQSAIYRQLLELEQIREELFDLPAATEIPVGLNVEEPEFGWAA